MEQLEKKVDKILFYLESDPATNQKGLVEQVSDNTHDINELRTHNKVTTGKIVVTGTILGIIGGIALKLLGLIKFVI